jgi:hypothetical protein
MATALKKVVFPQDRCRLAANAGDPGQGLGQMKSGFLWDAGVDHHQCHVNLLADLMPASITSHPAGQVRLIGNPMGQCLKQENPLLPARALDGGHLVATWQIQIKPDFTFSL